MEQEAQHSNAPRPEELANQRKLLLNLEKVMRSYRLYEARGNQYEAHLNELSGQAALATELTQVSINLSPFGPFLEGDQPPSDGEYARQWFTLFEEGARQIVFQPGVDGGELRELLHIICSESEDNEDIVTALWRKNLNHIQVFVARVLIRTVAGSSEQSSSIQEDLSRWKALLGGPAAKSNARQGEEDLIQLSPDDFRVLSLKEEAFDWCSLSVELEPEDTETRKKPRIVEAVSKEIGDFNRFLELANDVGEGSHDIILNVIAGMTRMGAVDDLNRMLSTIAKRGGGTAGVLQQMMDKGDGLEALLPLIEAAPDSFEDALSALSEIDSDAVSSLLGKVEREELRDNLKGFVATPEEAPMQYYSSRLLSENSEEALEAVEKLTELGTDEAFVLAMGGYRSANPSVRRQVMRKVFARYNPTLSYMAQQALMDTDKGIRILTLRFIGENGNTTLLREVLKFMKQRDFGKRDFSERIAAARCVGRHTRLPVINQYLCEVLLEYRIFGSRENLEYQIEVARLLLRSNNPNALQAIKKVLARWSVPDEVKQAIRQEQVRISEAGTEQLNKDPTTTNEDIDYMAESARILAAEDTGELE
ncbi:MAG: hypothetical protein CMP23_14895 [Rickettsiales bacterium]|nr:hypothetical protein [Rickettsiales bacterium]|tara:strand:+ start:2345 stop:4123 length:1779 start_codon:yes stop_codon:yes gene_type:complete